MAVVPDNPLLKYILHLADNTLVLGQRLGEWCGHGPVLEQDIALTNISLDLIGQARLYYQYAAIVDGQGHTEDFFPYHRDGWDFFNVLLVEQPNGDWGQTIIRQFLFDSWHYYFLEALMKSSDSQLASIAEKSLKEVTYHLRYSSEWVIRLGDGTEESNDRMQQGLDMLWRYSEEFFNIAPYEQTLLPDGISVHQEQLRQKVSMKRAEIFTRATLTPPTGELQQTGGKLGHHTEHLGYILTELQYVQKSYPGLEW